MTGLLLILLLANPAAKRATIQLEGARAEEAVYVARRDVLIERQRMGMVTMAQSLANLVNSGRVRKADAESVMSDPSELQAMLRAA